MKRLTLPPNWTHRHYETVPSTMLCCDPFGIEPGHFLLVTADEQTAGRGQRGTHWESTKGENLTFNVGWRAPSAPLPLGFAACNKQELPPIGGELVDADRPHWPAANEQFLISEITALAVLRAIEDTLSAHTGPSPIGGGWEGAIKWPNDIYVVRTAEDSPLRSTDPSPYRGELEGGFKICGMLLEHQLSGKHIAASIAGIGINVNQASFATLAGREEGRGAPISLRQIVGHEVSREAVLEAFVRHFMEGVALLQKGRYDEIEADFLAHLFRRTGLHRYRDADGEFLGEFVSIARNGTLTLRKVEPSLREHQGSLCSEQELRSYAFKEVAYVMVGSINSLK